MAHIIEKNTTGGPGLMKRMKKTLALKPDSNKFECRLSIDFPQEKEKVREGSYSVRISSDPNSDVEISINDGPWEPCRESVGHWWFDWSPKSVARCKLVARSRVGQGRWKKSNIRSCEIIACN